MNTYRRNWSLLYYLFFMLHCSDLSELVAWPPLETWLLSSWGSEGTQSRSSSCVALLVHERGAQDRRHALVFLLLNRVLKIIIVRRCEWWRSEQELHAHRELLVVDPRCHEFTRMNLSTFPLPSVSLSMSDRQIFGVGLLLHMRARTSLKPHALCSREIDLTDLRSLWSYSK
jgi:hypothetical protein